MDYWINVLVDVWKESKLLRYYINILYLVISMVYYNEFFFFLDGMLSI